MARRPLVLSLFALILTVALQGQTQAERPPTPTRSQVTHYRGCLANVKDSAGRVVWSPALPGASPEVFDEWMSLLRTCGATHVPVGPFTPGPVYPGVAWSNPDWTNDPEALRSFFSRILNTKSASGYGFIPTIFADGGGSSHSARIAAFLPVLSRALDGIAASVIVVPTGWESSSRAADISAALQQWHTLRPESCMGFHGQPQRWTGVSAPLQPDDPWQGNEKAFLTSHGGEHICISLYQTPHGSSLYNDCDASVSSCWLHHFEEYVKVLGAGHDGWRTLPVVLFETCAYEFFRGQASDAQCRDLASRARSVAEQWRVNVGYGNGLPK